MNFDRQYFIDGYIEAMLWANTYGEDENGEMTTDNDVSFGDLTEEALRTMQDDCGDFLGVAEGIVERNLNDRYDSAHAGHDFALTRNHHGAGFWDRGLGDDGDLLTDIAQGFGDSNLQILENGEIVCE